MFLGTYRVKFSGHARAILPKKLREELKVRTGVILTRGLDGCVWGFDKEDWVTEAKKQLEVSITKSYGRNLRRYIFAQAGLVELDKQGRLVIPSELLAYAKVEDEIYIIGAGDHFEIWNLNSWENISFKDLEI